jgi:hypothetical protein
MHFDDPAALDTNHDGEISADELAAGMEARRDQWRASRQGSGTAVGSDGQPVVRNLGRTGSATPSGQ